MENRQLTTAELYALEQKARLLRAQEMARLLKAGANAVRKWFMEVRPAKGLRHA